MDNDQLVHTHIRILVTHGDEIMRYMKMGSARDCSVKQNKPDSERQMLWIWFIAYVN